MREVDYPPEDPPLACRGRPSQEFTERFREERPTSQRFCGTFWRGALGLRKDFTKVWREDWPQRLREKVLQGLGEVDTLQRFRESVCEESERAHCREKFRGRVERVDRPPNSLQSFYGELESRPTRQFSFTKRTNLSPGRVLRRV